MSAREWIDGRRAACRPANYPACRAAAIGAAGLVRGALMDRIHRMGSAWLVTLLLASVPVVQAASVSYSYDVNDRVTRAAYSDGTVVNYTYDVAGNILTRAITGGTPAAPLNATGLWWNPSESGWGINFSHQGDIIFATWFTYDAQGKPWWLIALLSRSADGVYSGPVSTVAGPLFNSVPFGPAPVETEVGTMTATFAGAKQATIAYSVNGTAQTKAIQPQAFGTLPTCAWGGQPNLALATNHTDLWWNANESGWGVNFSHQGDIIFATWFTYDGQGKPWWLIAVLSKGAGKSYSGPVSTVAGPLFGSVPFGPAPVETEVGTMTSTFADGNAATLAYTVNGTSRTKAIARQVFVPPGTVCH